jgi:hypothetical protein
MLRDAAHRAILSMRGMHQRIPHLRKRPTGPRVARQPEDRPRGCLEERIALIQPGVGDIRRFTQRGLGQIRYYLLYKSARLPAAVPSGT